jgi:hypothetical protein
MSYSYEFSSSSHDQAGQAPSVSVRLGQSALSRDSQSQNTSNHRSTVSFASNIHHNAVSAAVVTSQSVLSGSSRTPASSRNAHSQNYGSSYAGDSSPAAGFLSEVEQAILRSNVPLEINESEEITVLGQRGIWANRAEVVNWRGVVPIGSYKINEDDTPEIITKRTQQRIE